MIEWKIFNIEAINLEFLILIDYQSLIFLSCVLLITRAIITYSEFYIEQRTKKIGFIKIIILFVSSIAILILRPNIISLIIGWEGLGISSFVLIMFYQNKKSLIRAIFTIVINRLGDIIIILRILKIINLNSWMFNSMLFIDTKIMIAILIIGAFSKRAQIPFSSWLTEAMAAPTPISALVHSSTLVTAGVYLIIRLELTIKYSNINKIIFVIRIATIIIASVNSLIEWDIKKLVALSTLSQLRLIFITISINIYQLAIFHVLIHAIFKALIFLCRRSIISFSNTQDIRKILGSSRLTITIIRFNIATLALCGFPFIAGFYSKDLIIEIIRINNKNWIINRVFYLCIWTTIIYSVKTRIILTTKKRKIKQKTSAEKKFQTIRKILLLTPTIILGNKINWIINLNFKIAQISVLQKTLPLIIITISVLTIERALSHFKLNKIKYNFNYKFLNYMWFLKSIGFTIKNLTLLVYFSTFKNREKGVFTQIIKTTTRIPINIRKKWFSVTHKKFKNIRLIIIISLIIVIFLNSLK